MYNQQTHALVFTDTEAAHHAPTIALCTEIAREMRGKVQFINILAEDEKKLEYFDVKAGELIVVSLHYVTTHTIIASTPMSLFYMFFIPSMCNACM
jgi:hypothetical protein